LTDTRRQGAVFFKIWSFPTPFPPLPGFSLPFFYLFGSRWLFERQNMTARFFSLDDAFSVVPLGFSNRKRTPGSVLHCFFPRRCRTCGLATVLFYVSLKRFITTCPPGILGCGSTMFDGFFFSPPFLLTLLACALSAFAIP